MIVLKVQGRLGNQLFQYAFAKSLQKKFYNNEKIIINYSKSKYSLPCYFCNDNKFNFETLESTYKWNLNIIQIFIFYAYTIYRLVFKKHKDIQMQPFLNRFGIYYLQDDGICDFKKSKFKNKLVFGYFGSEKFFEYIKEEIKNDFKLNIPLSNKNQKFLKEIQNSNSIALSIRRGDYTSQDISHFFLVCEKSYYEEAIKVAQDEIKDSRFVVFSDDIEWAKENIQFPKDKNKVLYEDKENEVLETFYLMKNCKNFIISNSTFHWWAQYLSENKTKKVYAPSIWNNERTALNIYLKNWKLIDIDKCRSEKNEE